MDLRYMPEEEAFRAEVRRFFADRLPDDIREHLAAGGHPPPEMLRRWTRILDDKGWSTPGWPTEYGGPGWSPMQRYIFGEELELAPAPIPLPFGVNMVGPVIYTFGSEAQKARFLPGIRTLDTWWCQGFSEPGAGSDLASLKTSARRVSEPGGDHYIVDGQKAWTSYAQYADWIFCLVRTDPAAKKQAGISFLLIDMKTPGITVRPIVTIEGGHEVNEVFFDAVRVPVENLVGEENRGWDYAKFLLGHERLSIARVGTSKQRLRRIRELAAIEEEGGRPLLANPRFAERLAALEVELKALELTQLRVVSAARAPDGKPDPATSILKIRGSEIQQATTELLMEVAGPYALPFRREGSNEEAVGADWASVAAPTYFNWRKIFDLRRIERDPEDDHRQSVPRTLMDFGLDDDQRLLKDSVGRLLADRYGFAQRARHMREAPGYAPAMWRAFAELGLLAIPFGEAEGGLGLSPVETMIVMEAFGGALVIEPYLASIVLAGGLLRHTEGGGARTALIAGLADGSRTAAFAHHERRARYDLAHVETRARRDGDIWRIDGEKSLVLHGDSADTLIVSARIGGTPADPDGIALFLVEGEAVKRRGYPTQDGMRAAEVMLADTPATPIGPAGGALPIIEQVVDEAIAALCAEAVGAMAALIELTADYLKTRQQFGVAIGSFQALQHRAAEMVVQLEQARSMALFATMMVTADDSSARSRAIHAAKVQIGRSAKFVGEQAVQLHGGIGMTDEYKVGHYLKRLTMIDLAFGNADHHLARLAAMGGL